MCLETRRFSEAISSPLRASLSPSSDGASAPSAGASWRVRCEGYEAPAERPAQPSTRDRRAVARAVRPALRAGRLRRGARRVSPPTLRASSGGARSPPFRAPPLRGGATVQSAAAAARCAATRRGRRGGQRGGRRESPMGAGGGRSRRLGCVCGGHGGCPRGLLRRAGRRCYAQRPADRSGGAVFVRVALRLWLTIP